MRVGPWLDTALTVFAPDPANRHHPANRGLAAWWLALPPTDGGRLWYDLAGTSDGTLSGGPTWGPTRRPGGFGQLNFSGSNTVTTGDPPGGKLDITGPAISLGGWVFPTGSGGFQLILGRVSAGGKQYALYLSTGTGTVSLLFDHLNGGGFVTIAAPSPWVIRDWNHLFVTYDGANVYCYLNGIRGAATALTGSIGTVAGTAVTIGLTGSSAFAGALDDLAIYNYALSPAEVAARYDLSRRGYPGALNRIAPTSYPPATGATGGAATLSGSSTASATGALSYAGTAQAGSSSAAAAAGELSYAGAAAIGGASTVLAAGGVAYDGATTLASVSSASGTLAAAGALSLASQSSISASGATAYDGLAAPASVSAATAAGGTHAAGAAQIGGTSTLTAAGSLATAGRGHAGPLARLLCLIRARRAQAPEPLPDDLLGAVKARFLATPALTGALPGGIYLAERPRDLDAPSVAVQETGARLDRTSDTSQIHDTRITFKVYGPDPDTAGAHGEILIAAFKGRNLEFQQGYSNRLVRHNRRHEKERWWGRGGEDVWYLLIEFQCRVLRY